MNEAALKDQETDEPKGSQKTKEFYKAVWRCHFYAGLFVIPFIIILSVTGIIYLFKLQLDTIIYRDLLVVTPRSETTLPEDQERAVKEQFPNALIRSYIPAAEADRSSQFEITDANKRELSVFVDPYIGKVLGNYETKNSLANFAFRIHGELLIGKWGDHIVELVASWAIVMVLTGLYLWFPRGNGGLVSALLPSLRKKSRRSFWRGLHSSAGFYGSLIILFMLISGLFWTEFWGGTFAGVWSGFPRDKDSSVFSSQALTGSLNNGLEKKIAWAAETMPLPESGHHDHGSMAMSEPADNNTDKDISLDSLVALAKENDLAQGYSILFPQNRTGVYTISAPVDDPLKQETIHLDRYSGKILAKVGWKDYPTVPRIVSFAISIHQGRYFGIANQLLMLAAALVVLLLAFSGIIMWWNRRPPKSLGAPQPPSDPWIRRSAVAIILLLGILLPFVGISLLIVLIFDLLILRRLPGNRSSIG